MTDKVRIGVVGTSWWADMMYLPSLTNHPRTEIAAICGRNKDRADEMANKYAISQVFTDYRAMFENAHLDAAVIAVPDDMHYPITMAALDAHLHVLCEKPLALTADHAHQMYEKAEAAGVVHLVLFTWRWLPILRKVKALVDEGYVGRCYHCQFHYLGDYGLSGQYAWRFDRRRGNGILGDLGSHMIDLTRWFVGDIASVSARLATCVQRLDAHGRALDSSDVANDSATLMLEFANGAHGVIHVSAVTHIADHIMEIHVRLEGESGRLEIDIPFGGQDAAPVIRGVRHGEKPFQVIAISDAPEDAIYAKPVVEYAGDLYSQQPVGVRLFVDAIHERRAVSPSFYDGWKAQQVVDAALKSHETGCWVSV